MLSGAEGCSEAEKNAPAGRDPIVMPDRVPDPNPDTGPQQPARTPGPVNGDPNPEFHRTWALFVAWSPGKEFVQTNVRIGGHRQGNRERTGGAWSDRGTTHRGAAYIVTAKWTDASYANLQRLHVTGEIKIVLTIDGKEVCEPKTSHTAPRGISCSGNVP
jgi:hypothetical protein